MNPTYGLRKFVTPLVGLAAINRPMPKRLRVRIFADLSNQRGLPNLTPWSVAVFRQSSLRDAEVATKI